MVQRLTKHGLLAQPAGDLIFPFRSRNKINTIEYAEVQDSRPPDSHIYIKFQCRNAKPPIGNREEWGGSSNLFRRPTLFAFRWLGKREKGIRPDLSRSACQQYNISTNATVRYRTRPPLRSPQVCGQSRQRVSTAYLPPASLGLCLESSSSRILLSSTAVSSVRLLTSACAAEVLFPASNEATIADKTVALNAATPKTIARTAPTAVTMMVVLRPAIDDRISDLISDIVISIRAMRASK